MADRPALRDVRLRARYATAGLRALPDFVVIGAQKAGTTSVYDWLARHPNVSPAMRKEVRYFDRRRDRSLRWYRAHFPVRRRGSITGESSPGYLFCPWVPEAVARALPTTRFVVLLRDPVDRAYSHYWMNRTGGREARSFEDAVAAEAGRTAPNGDDDPYGRYAYVARGRYAEQLERWFAVIDRDRFLVAFTDKGADQRALYGRVLDFLGLPPFELELSPSNVARYEEMDPATRRRLEAELAPDNRRLAALLGEHPGW